ncbi:MAG: hypothetical protein HY327_00685 [Chloroflexi bacterium]|nr:hypothetical protein [Chloroflexota bacterium]
MDILIIALRLIHIFAGVFWAGVAFFLVSYLTPAIKKSGAAGGQVMQQLLRSSYPRVIPLVAFLNVASGLALYWLDSSGLQQAWLKTGTGIGFTFGAITGLIAFGVAYFVTAPAANQMARIGMQIAQAGKPPSAEQQNAMGKWQGVLVKSAYYVADFLALALVAMATARYLHF